MEVVKIIKKVYKVIQATSRPFAKFGRFKKVRESIGLSCEKSCFNCGHKFKEEEDVYLVMLTNTHNRFFCKECNDKALLDLSKELSDERTGRIKGAADQIGRPI